jgi:hypothetical protein
MTGGTITSVVTVEEEIIAMDVAVMADGETRKERMRIEKPINEVAADEVMTVVKDMAEMETGAEILEEGWKMETGMIIGLPKRM